MSCLSISMAIIPMISGQYQKPWILILQCLTQANSISTSLKQNFGIDEKIAGVVVAVFTAIVIIGGVKSITKVTEKLIPFMAAFYVLGCLWVIYMNKSVLGASIALIFKSAFSFQAGAGGVFGFSVAQALLRSEERRVGK